MFKACSCDGTSSGPRSAFVPRLCCSQGDRITGYLVYAQMVCDVCDEPWTPDGKLFKPEPTEGSTEFYTSNATKLFDKVMQSEGNRTRFEELMESAEAARNSKSSSVSV